jgi:hypothetical protein
MHVTTTLIGMQVFARARTPADPPSDLESVVSSGEDNEPQRDDGHGKDWCRGLAQRCTDPYIKARNSKGVLVVRGR